ncbi:MAG: LptE family protein [Flavobacteriales bacterium]|nr:LptE family protein [Flavobacteriales bacterium]
MNREAVGSWRLAVGKPGVLPTAYCLMLLLLPACRVNYSFSGGDVGQAKTLTVDLFDARAPLATPSAAQTFTETVRDLLLAQTPLKLARENGDLQYSGSITGYDVQPVSIQANETAALNRLTMTASVTYVNTLEPKKNAQFTISRFADYDSSQDLTTVESQLVNEIGKQLAQDIFDRTLGSW